jgi:signal peptidase I
MKKQTLIAIFLSLILPGLGQIYNRQAKKTIVSYLLLYTSIVALYLAGFPYRFWGLAVVLALLLCFYFWSVADAVLANVGRRADKLTANRKPYLLLFALLWLIGASSIPASGKVLSLRAFYIPTNSMAPTIAAGDSIVVDMNYYQVHQPARGEVVLLRHAPASFVPKRIVAVGGDTIRGEANRVYVNGNLVKEPYAQFMGRQSLDKFNVQHAASGFASTVVPAGQLFVMGDNRDNSFDSRDPEFGLVEVGDVLGKPLYVYWTRDRSRIGRSIA